MYYRHIESICVYILTFVEYLLNVRCQAPWGHFYILFHLIILETSEIVTCYPSFPLLHGRRMLSRKVNQLDYGPIAERQSWDLNPVPSHVNTNYCCLLHWIYVCVCVFFYISSTNLYIYVYKIELKFSHPVLPLPVQILFSFLEHIQRVVTLRLSAVQPSVYQASPYTFISVFNVSFGRSCHRFALNLLFLLLLKRLFSNITYILFCCCCSF